MGCGLFIYPCNVLSFFWRGILLQKKFRLKRREDFKKVFRIGRSTANREFVVYLFSRREPGPIRFGMSVSKRVGNAVVRNRIKRSVKEICRHWTVDMLSNADVVIIVRKPVATMDFKQMKSSLRHVFQRAKMFTKVPSSEKE